MMKTLLLFALIFTFQKEQVRGKTDIRGKTSVGTSAVGVTTFLLKEAGDVILLEDGTKLKTEN